MKKNILSQSAWWTINKALTKEIGIDASLLLSDLLSKREYFKTRNQLAEDGSFFNTRDKIKEDTTLTLHRQNKALEILKEKMFLTYSNKGVPPKTRFNLNIHYINEIVKELHEEDDEY